MVVKTFQPYVDIMQPPSEVTGSFILNEVKLPTTTVKFSVDCGLFQEKNYELENDKFIVSPDSLDFVALTHNHVDHNGRLPYLVRHGFSGSIYTTNVTKAILGLSLDDNVRVLKRRFRESKMEYDFNDVANTLDLVVGCDFNQYVDASEHIRLYFNMNGHLFGAATVLAEIHYPRTTNTYILYSGDYNNKNMFFYVSPLRKWITELPINVVIESTYGTMNSRDIKKVFSENVTSALEDDKTIVLPVFSLGRAQEILYVLKRMQMEGLIDVNIPIYYDGKLSFDYTNAITKMQEDGMLHFYEDKIDFMPENVTKIRDPIARGRVINDHNPKIIVTTSGNGSYGSAQIYIKELIQRRNVLIHFTGFCTEDSLGYELKATPKMETVWVCGAKVLKLADVEFTSEFSAHAKADELIGFLRQFKDLRSVLVTHGTMGSKDAFAERIVKEVKCKDVGILGKGYAYRINSQGLEKAIPTTLSTPLE